MSLSGQVGALATRIGTEIKTLRTTFVPNTLRGPIGGVNASTGVSGTVNLNPALSNQYRLTATGDVTIAAMSAGGDGQRLLLEISASGGQRIIVFDSSYELSRAVPVRTFTIPSGQWAYIALVARGATWRLVSAEPQAVPDTSTPSAWVPADHGLIAWSTDPALASSLVGNGSGALVGSEIKVSVSDTSTSVSFSIITAGVGFTANRNYVGLYNPAGVLVAQTADLASTINTAGVKTVPWNSSVTVTPGDYYCAFITTSNTTSSSSTQFAAAPSGNGATARGRSPLGWRGSVSSGTYTALPASRPTPASAVTSPWFGLE